MNNVSGVVMGSIAIAISLLILGVGVEILGYQSFFISYAAVGVAMGGIIVHIATSVEMILSEDK
ncbi:hypothetical protein A6E01_20270 (plasmid) [Vibrio breoganii]|uniref:Uncharacterized protein n=1 Tax=Vibrio breoganii TaxID=553239 RepID=A0AAN0XZK4_9VIBR|nr:hypothetical protein [Vibrio breoganii]ANO35550.1 hypothetical protein A6E01_20270 [Vibrio breoganii]PML15813.1 hypothetical protein BCT84_07365 [Vibrio breoganii]